MEETEHVLIVGNGANEFAISKGFTPVDPELLICDREKDYLRKVKSDPNYKSRTPFSSTYKPPTLSPPRPIYIYLL